MVSIFDVITIGLLVVLVFFIWLLRRSSSRQIYVIWYIFSFCFVLFSSLFFTIYFAETHANTALAKWAAKLVATLSQYMLDVGAELELVLAVVGLVVLPQLMTYFLSGLSGSASRPVFVARIVDMSIWSLIKFLAAYAGLTLGFVGYDWVLTGRGSFSFIYVQSVLALTLAFFLAYLLHASGQAIDFLFKKDAFFFVRRAHEFFTRHSQPAARAPEDVERFN